MVKQMIEKILRPFLTSALSVTELIRSAKANSLVEYASHTRAEPRCLIENEISNLPEMPDIARTMLTIFSGYYLASVSIATNVGDINIIKQLVYRIGAILSNNSESVCYSIIIFCS